MQGRGSRSGFLGYPAVVPLSTRRTRTKSKMENKHRARHGTVKKSSKGECITINMILYIDVVWENWPGYSGVNYVGMGTFECGQH